MDPKSTAQTTISNARERLIDLSHRIHANPELGFEEHLASGWVADELTAAGFRVTRGVAGLPTALTADYGSGDLVVGIVCEYDALPAIGHACGHNIIAAAGVGAALGLAPLADELGITVRVFGCPAEEGGGGKIIMLDAGVFDGTHAATMIHAVPAPVERADTSFMAGAHLQLEFFGKAAQAAEWPHEGINAADAMTVAQVAVGLLRQQLVDGDRIHGFISHGGDAPNVIPAYTAAKYVLRAPTLEGLLELRPRFEACFEAGALATGATLKITETSPVYAEMINDDALADRFTANAQALGRVTSDLPTPRASSDMANVSHVVRSLHPSMALECGTAVNHQPEFTEYCASESADRMVIDGATAMAWTYIDIATDPLEREQLIASAAALVV